MRQASVLLLNICFIQVHDIEYDIELGVKRKFHCVKVFDIYQQHQQVKTEHFCLHKKLTGCQAVDFSPFFVLKLDPCRLLFG